MRRMWGNREYTYRMELAAYNAPRPFNTWPRLISNVFKYSTEFHQSDYLESKMKRQIRPTVFFAVGYTLIPHSWNTAAGESSQL